MGAGALQPSNNPQPHLRVVSGPMEGQSFALIGKKLTIGRSSDNDIVLKHDSKCSRHHAIIRITQQGVAVESLSTKNPVAVNGQPVTTAMLLPGVTLSFGDTHISFVAPAPPPVTDLAVREQPGAFAAPTQEAPPQSQSRKKSSQTNSRQQKKSPVFMFVVVGVLGLLVYLLTADTGKKKAPTAITQEKDIEAEIKASEEIRRAKEVEARKGNKKTAQYKEAQAAYIRGFRDYKKGLFGRARDSFQTCLSLYPAHTLCQRYLGLSNRKFDEIVQFNLRLGKDHRERNQFRACMSAMRTVLVMVRNKSDKRFKQAKAHFEACEVQLG
ncbi:MAG: FHA domain-containing protein, partial [Pseudomonadota bacterium]